VSLKVSPARRLYRERWYVHALLLLSFLITGALFYALYLLLYPYLAIIPTSSNVGAPGPDQLLQSTAPLSVMVSALSFALTSRPALFLFYTILAVCTFLNELSYFPLAAYHRLLAGRRRAVNSFRLPYVSVILPAHNEERVIETAVQTLVDVDYPNGEIIVVNDGSTDQTEKRIWRYVQSGAIRLINRPCGGKAAAVNTGIAVAQGDIIVVLDADSAPQRDSIRRLVNHFEDPMVVAVSGNVKVGNRVNLLTRLQSLEYIRGINLRRRAFDVLDSELVVPGAIGAFRKTAYREVGTMDRDTVVEDMDLTVRLGKAGGDVRYEPQAVAFTEAPEDVRSLVRQRTRWYGGTFQTWLKHRHRWWSFGPLSSVGFPYLTLSMFFIPIVELVTLAFLFLYLVQGLFLGVLLAAVSILVIEFALSSAAVLLDGEDPRLILHTPMYAFIYRYLLDAIRVKAYWDVYRKKIGWTRPSRHGELTERVRESALLR
jgi:cellulose synthase/poly-beta-1,6-N-acetylglucosamine synthase-like glycosyltransferase